MVTGEDERHAPATWRALRALSIVLAAAMGLTGMGPGQAAVGPTGGPLPRELDGTWSVLAGDRTAPGNFQSPTGLAVDTQGNVYVDDTQNFRIEKLSPAGQFITAFGDYGNGDGQFTLANGLAVDRAGNIYVADTESSSIEKLSPRGYPLAEWNQYGSAPGELEYPTDRVLQYSLSAPKLLSSWGRDERARGEFLFPTAVALGPAGTLDVADKGNSRIEQVPTTATGPATPSVVWSLPQLTAKRIGLPVGAATDPSGDLYVVDGRKGGVAKLLPNGAPAPKWPADRKGLPADPIGVAVDPHGDAYIADGATSQIWRLDPAGRLLSRWGRGRGDAPGQFRFDRAGPAGIATDLQGHIYVAASSNDGGALFSDPRPVFGAFNVNRALPDGGQYFLGDYQGLVAVGAEFHPFFVAGNTGNKEDPVDVFTGALQP